MLVDYIQTPSLETSRRALGCLETISRTDVNPLFNEDAFRAQRAIGLYAISDGHCVSAATLKLNEAALTKFDKWALGSPLIHPFTIRTLDDLVHVMRCEWTDDKLTHPRARDICVQQVFAYRVKCFMRKLFNPNYLPTPQLVVRETSQHHADALTFICTGQGV